MTRTAVHVPLFGDTKRFIVKQQGADPKSAEFSDFSIANELAKRVVALPGEKIRRQRLSFRGSG